MDKYLEKMTDGCLDELRKIASKKYAGIGPLGIAALLGGGAVLGLKARKMKQDYQMGAQMRKQQGY